MRASSLLALAASAFILLGQAFPLSPLADAVHGGAFAGAALAYPPGYALSAPFSALADAVTFSSAAQIPVWLAWLFLGYWLRPARRRWLGWLAWCVLAAGFLAWALLLPRPIARLVLSDPEEAALDLHSHSSCSHDGRRSFTPEANAAWHARAGFRAGFLTDHNTQACARPRAAAPGYQALAGTELSLHGAHVVVLAPRADLDLERYQGGGRAGLSAFLSEARGAGSVPIQSLPEYWRHHRAELERLLGEAPPPAGVEVSNGAPKALRALDQGAREAVLPLARRLGLFPACASDNHGWAQAPYCWNVLRLSGHAAMGAEELEGAVFAQLARGGFAAVRVAERRRAQASAGLLVLLDPLRALWLLCRTLSPLLAAFSLAWVWTLCAAARSFQRRT